MGVTTADPVLFRPLHRKYDRRGNLKAELKIRKGAPENKTKKDQGQQAQVLLKEQQQEHEQQEQQQRNSNI